MKFSFVRYLTSADRFGHKPELHYAGSTKFRTALGGCASVILYVLVLINAFNIVSDFINDENQKEVNRLVSADLKELGQLALAD